MGEAEDCDIKMIFYVMQDDLAHKLGEMIGDEHVWLAEAVALGYARRYGDRAHVGTDDEGSSGPVRVTDLGMMVLGTSSRRLVLDFGQYLEAVYAAGEPFYQALGRGVVDAVAQMLEYPLPTGCLHALALVCEMCPLEGGFSMEDLFVWAADEGGRLDDWRVCANEWGGCGIAEMQDLVDANYIVSISSYDQGLGATYEPSAWPCLVENFRWIEATSKRWSGRMGAQ